MAIASPSGFAIRRSGSCLPVEVDCGATAPPYRACCPAGSSCPTQFNVNCCPNAVNCTQELVQSPKCANRTWTLYDNTGYFCCEIGTIGYGLAISDGCAGLGAALPNGARFLQVLREGQSSPSSSARMVSSTTASIFSSASPSSTISSSKLVPSSPTSSDHVRSASGGQSGTAAIAGCVLGGIIAAALVCGAIWFWKRQKKIVTTIVEGHPGTNHGVLEKDGGSYVNEADGLTRYELSGRYKAAATEVP